MFTYWKHFNYSQSVQTFRVIDSPVTVKQLVKFMREQRWIEGSSPGKKDGIEWVCFTNKRYKQLKELSVRFTDRQSDAVLMRLKYDWELGYDWKADDITYDDTEDDGTEE